MRSFLITFRAKLRQDPLIILFAVLAVATVLTPIQHYFSLGRYQHYGLGVMLWGLGYLLQSVWSWTSAPFWRCLSYLSLSLYFGSAGFVFYTNSWLDPKVAVQTNSLEHIRFLLGVVYLLLLLPIAYIWYRWFKEEEKLRTKR